MRGFVHCASVGILMLFIAAASGQDTNFSTGPQYLMHGSSLLARPISTPSMSLAGPLLEVGASDASNGLVAGAGNRNVLPPNPDALPMVNLFPIYYGQRSVSMVEIRFSSETAPNPLPESLLNSGAWQVTTAEALRDSGCGLTLTESASQSKAKTRHAARVYTNADIDRLHGGG